MTEERIKELARIWFNRWCKWFKVSVEQHTTIPIIFEDIIRTVAAEAREEGRKEGINEAVKIALPCLIESENIKKIFTLEIERLKEKGK